ncbi:leucine-rich repeat protein, partial [Tanacetum coccineum]
TVFAILCFVYVWCKKKCNGQPSQSTRIEQVLKVSYGQLLKAINSFSEANLIGKGGFSSVYKGTLDNVDNFVDEIDEDPDISLVQQMIHHDVHTQGRQEHDLELNFEFTAHEEVYTAEPDISTANVPVSTTGVEASTAIPKVSTFAESLVYIRRSVAKRVDKGKSIMKEAEPVQKKTKLQLVQERLGYEEALRLQDEEE